MDSSIKIFITVLVVDLVTGKVVFSATQKKVQRDLGCLLLIQ